MRVFWCTDHPVFGDCSFLVCARFRLRLEHDKFCPLSPILGRHRALEAGRSPVVPIAWKGTLAQYAGRLHRLYDARREVIIYDYADMRVPVLARMAAKRRVG